MTRTHGKKSNSACVPNNATHLYFEASSSSSGVGWGFGLKGFFFACPAVPPRGVAPPRLGVLATGVARGVDSSFLKSWFDKEGV